MISKRPIIIVTGSSGSGKSTALAAFEDAGFYCVDNMPLLLVEAFLNRYAAEDTSCVGWTFGMDLRDKDFLSCHADIFDALAAKGHSTRIVFLDADEQVLLRRYNQTRRHHPLADGGRLLDAIRAEKHKLTPLKSAADHLIDTSHLSIHELKFVILGIAQRYAVISSMTINVVSFGFKHGAPPEADLVVDVRFLSNPYFVPALAAKDGESPEVFAFVTGDALAGQFLQKYMDLLDFLIPLYQKEGKAYLTIAIGCTGGRHRSVVIAQQIYKHVKRTQPSARLIHRDIRYSA
jgi:UPF0042 nucleotide-binding protein